MRLIRNDIGSWSSLWEVSPKDGAGNVTSGDVMLHKSKRCFAKADGKFVAMVGVEDLIVVTTQDAILVSHKDAVQDAKIIAGLLKEQGRPEWEVHTEVYRPWGKFCSVDQGAGYQVKRIMVNPGQKLSVQMHHYRAEHWVVVSGTAKVTKGDEEFLLSENESTYIPIGEIHSLENPAEVVLEIIEIQSGTYLGEDDIVRFSDRYGRVVDSN